MRAFFSILALLASSSLVFAGDFAAKPLLAFSLAATNQSFSEKLGSGLVLRVERNEIGWEVGVFRHEHEDSLLYPQHNWHGAFPCQLSAWSQKSQTFPNERIIPIRGQKGSVRIRLIDAKVAGEPGNESFIGGRVEIFYKHDA